MEHLCQFLSFFLDTLFLSNEVEDYPSNDSLYNNDDPMEYEGSIFNEYLVDFDQFLVQVYPRDDVLERAASQKPTSDQMNVMMIMLDSMSHMSFRRKLPKTYGYLKKNLASTILNGYNIVGDATLAALIPILTGIMKSLDIFIKYISFGSLFIM